MSVRAQVLRLLGAVLLVAGGLVGSATAPAAVRAATPDLTLVTAATYDVHPEERRVAVSVAITATNHLNDTATRRYYFDAGYLAVLPGTSGFAISSPGLTPKVSVAATKKEYTLLKIAFGTKLGSGSSLPLTLTFDIKDPGGAPDRPVRISPSLISFFVWAYATDSTPGSSVRVRLPDGYNVTIDRGPLKGPTKDEAGAQFWTSGALASPLTFIADIDADKPGGYTQTSKEVSVGDGTATVLLDAWPDDPEWAARVGDLFAKGLPALGAQIGLPWPMDKPLTVQETLVRSTGGYAGLFDPSSGHVQVAYAADPVVVLHEAAHSWLNGNLVADRWAAEAFASYYAANVATALKIKAAPPELTPALRKVAFPLNAWGPVDQGGTDTEAYGYAASLALANEIASRLGADRLRMVWQAANDRRGAYQPSSGAVEKVTGAPDWRGLLDLCEEVGQTSFEDLWRTWVVRPDDLSLLADRATARTAYTALVGKAGDWRLPRSIRDAMRTWQFSVAGRAMAEASSVLDQRAALERAAAAANLRLPDTLRLAFQGDDGLAAAASEASAEQATVEALVAAGASRPASIGPVETLGLVGTEPTRDLAAAGDALAKGDLKTAVADAARARTAYQSATEIGRGRLISIVLLVAAAGVAIVLVVQRRRATRVSAR